MLVILFSKYASILNDYRQNLSRSIARLCTKPALPFLRQNGKNILCSSSVASSQVAYKAVTPDKRNEFPAAQASQAAYLPVRIMFVPVPGCTGDSRTAKYTAGQDTRLP